ncbi:MAG: cytochrome c [Burkholderiales bacterium]
MLSRMQIVLPVLLLACMAAPAFAQGNAQGSVNRGEYLSKAAGCLGCHTEEKKGAVNYAGGRALKTPFGTFYGPNITPHPDAGIGKWTEADFAKALRHGKRPDGANYFPAFPYPSFTGMTDADVRDLWAYLRTLPANNQPSRPHDVGFPYNLRFAVTFWKALFFTPGAFTPDPKASEIINRGAYLTNALGHCGECHTPRNFMGGPRKERFLAGGKGPEGKDIPNLTPARLKKQWGDKELSDFLSSGLTPDGDVPAEAMGEVIRNTTGMLTPADLAAMIAYLRSLPAIENEKK